MKTAIDQREYVPKDASTVFRKLRTCSRTFFHILNKKFSPPKGLEELSVDSLSGGILQQKQQCGMLWGASLAVGGEEYRKCKDQNEAICVAIKATQDIMESLSKNENTINCKDITHFDFSSKLSFAKYMLSGRFLYCIKLIISSL